MTRWPLGALGLAAVLWPAEASAITRCDVVADAQSWVDNQVPYSQGPGASYCPGGYYCDPLRGGSCFRSDCSGLVSAAWGLPGPGHTTYSLGGGVWDDGSSVVISPGELQPGDALNYPGSPSQGTGHVMLYLSGDFNSGWVEVIEEYSCGQVATHHFRAIDTGIYLPIRYTGIEPCCTPHCEGSVIVDANCGTGDCAAYGANCVDDQLGVRCVFFACPPTGSLDVCVSDAIVGTCQNGALVSQGDCSQFAALCSTAGGQPAHCASIFCVASPQEVPTAHDVCFLDGQTYHCDDAGGISLLGCPGGETCSVYPDLHCEPGNPCPPGNDVTICYEDAVVGRCYGGGMVQVLDDCAAQAGVCSTAGGAAPHCVSTLCVASPGDVPIEHDICTADGQIAHCNANGELGTPAPCPDGDSCQQDDLGASCVAGNPDGGPADGGGLSSPAGDIPGDESQGSCGCRLGGAGSAGHAVSGCGLLVGLLGARRRRARCRWTTD